MPRCNPKKLRYKNKAEKRVERKPLITVEEFVKEYKAKQKERKGGDNK